MADVTIDANTVQANCRGPRAMVWATASVGYFFFIDFTGGFKYIKTTDGGASWSGLTVINAAAAPLAYDVWFDQWTPGDSGTLIHCWYFDPTVDDVFYRTLDISGDTLGTERTVFAGGSAASGRGIFVSGAKMRGGNLYCAFDIDAGAEKGLRRSTDAGVNWTARDTGTPIEATLDQCFLFPGNEADANDCWLLYHDADADELTLKMHDDSAATTSESAVIMTLVENTTDGTGQYGFSAAVRHSDGHLIVAAWSERDIVTADFRVFDVNGTGSIVEKTAIATDIDDSYYPSVFVASDGAIFVAYIGKRDGSETLDTTAGVYYVKSTDGGTSWSAGDTAYSATASDWRNTWAAPNGPRLAVAWRDISTSDLLTNSDNSVVWPAAAGQPAMRRGLRRPIGVEGVLIA